VSTSDVAEKLDVFLEMGEREADRLRDHVSLWTADGIQIEEEVPRAAAKGAAVDADAARRRPDLLTRPELRLGPVVGTEKGVDPRRRQRGASARRGQEDHGCERKPCRQAPCKTHQTVTPLLTPALAAAAAAVFVLAGSTTAAPPQKLTASAREALVERELEPGADTRSRRRMRAVGNAASGPTAPQLLVADELANDIVAPAGMLRVDRKL
jgi:hypothetical protein